MMLNIPAFETQIRGFDRNEVADYIARLHHEIEILQEHAKSLNAVKAQAGSDCEQLVAEVTRLQNDIVRRTADTDTKRRELIAELAQLRGQFEQATEPVDAVAGMSDRIARMLRIASEEARRTQDLARREAESLTEELREQLVAAKYHRDATNHAMAELHAAANARRAKILEMTTAEADEILRLAHEERDRIAQEIEAAERSRRAVYRRLAEEDERTRLAAQEALDEQVKLAWEEDERNRRESQHWLDQQLKAAWERAEATIDELDKAARSEAAVLIATAEREAGLLGERAQREVSLLERERGGIVADLDEIRNWIDTVVGDDAAG